MKTKDEILEILNNNKNGIYFRESVFCNLFPEEFKDIEFFMNKNSLQFDTFSQKLYHYIYNLTGYIYGSECGQKLLFISFKKGYRKYCSKNCACLVKDANTKRKITSITKYGVEHPNMLKENKDKISKTKKEKSYEDKKAIVEKQKKTFLAKYGEDNPSKVKSIIEKRVKSFKNNITSWKENYKKTCLERYGVDNPWKSDTVQKKYKNTMIEQYGVDNLLKSELIKDKSKHTCIEKYGNEYYINSEEGKNKIKQTILEKYGVDNVFKNRDVQTNIRLKLKENLNNKTLNKNTEIIKIYENFFVCKCVNESCALHTKCKHTYKISKSLFFQRKRYNIDTCIIKNKPYTYSGKQDDLYNYIKSFYKNCVKFNERTVLQSKKEIDIYLPDIKIGFEFNGDYWHYNPLYYSVSNEEKWITDMKKEYEANLQGISIYTIWENDWVNNNEYVKNKIKNIIENKIQKISSYTKLKSFINELGVEHNETNFGQFEFKNVIIKYVNAYYYNKNTIDKSWFLNTDKRVIYVYDYEINDTRKFDVIKSDIKYALNLTTTKIFARKCILKEITNKEARPFLLENSLFGHRNASVTLGLYYNNELVMVYSFGNNYYGRKKDIEVIRVCTKKNTVIVGGSSKCFNYYLNKYAQTGQTIIFYVDKIHHDGKSLSNFEFVRHEYGTMNYWRIDYADESFNGKEETAFNRMPSKHKEIKQLINNEIILEALTLGVDVYRYTIK